MPLGFGGEELVQHYIQLRLGDFGLCKKCGQAIGIDMFWGHRVHVDTIQMACAPQREGLTAA